MFHLAARGVFIAAARYLVSGGVERRCRRFQRLEVPQCERHRSGRFRACEKGQRMIAVIGAEEQLAVALLDELQAKDTLREIGRGREVGSADPDIAELLDFDH